MDWESEIKFYDGYPQLKKDNYSLLSTLLNSETSINILDFGSGDGKLIPYLKTDNNIHLYDINEHAINMAKDRLKSNNLTFHTKLNSIPKSYFDFVVCSLVVMCIDTRKALENLFTNILTVLKNDGCLLLVITNPYNRVEKFSYFHNTFNHPFNYFNNGMSYNVNINDHKITDFHWNMTLLLEIALKNYKLIRYIDLKDSKESENSFYNAIYPPYIILNLKK